MTEEDFEGTIVIEKLAEVGKVEDFFDAVDSDDFVRAKKLMRFAHIDHETIETVLRKMSAGDSSE